ncbi:DNA-binding protein [Streptomyces kanamyceticus]|uniref:DNA-binding protein n=1 Tax=Streptomyces kanamyceticus TaxID=1967 RepID=A0A5J6GCK4_STRKN|nr:DNA-binding protein [Streptomyces kanamyceticus]
MKVLRRTGLPTSYSAGEVAASLGCSEWWVKEQARRRRIPFLRSGGGYRFTSDHVQEIFHLLEERPSQASAVEGSSPPRRCANTQPTKSVTSLRARSPRRARKAA